MTAAPSRLPAHGGAAVCPICSGPCIGFDPVGPVLWEKPSMPDVETVKVGQKVWANGFLLYGIDDPIPRDHAVELAAQGWIPEDVARQFDLLDDPTPPPDRGTVQERLARKTPEGRPEKPPKPKAEGDTPTETRPKSRKRKEVRS